MRSACREQEDTPLGTRHEKITQKTLTGLKTCDDRWVKQSTDWIADSVVRGRKQRDDNCCCDCGRCCCFRLDKLTERQKQQCDGCGAPNALLGLGKEKRALPSTFLEVVDKSFLAKKRSGHRKRLHWPRLVKKAKIINR